jgi:hypothetical protein
LKNLAHERCDFRQLLACQLSNLFLNATIEFALAQFGEEVLGIEILTHNRA